MPLRLALAQFDFPVGAVLRNEQRIVELIVEARDVHGADLMLFPELALSGYPPEDLLYRPGFLAECNASIQRIAATVKGIVAVVGWPESAGAVVYNAASVLRDGVIERTYRKRELPNYAVFDERRYFEVDPDGEPCVVDVAGVKVGLVICEDLWFSEPIASTGLLIRSTWPSPSKSIAKRRQLPGMNWPQPIAPAYEPFIAIGSRPFSRARIRNWRSSSRKKGLRSRAPGGSGEG